MARPLRIEYPGATYHVMNRGNQRARVFYSQLHYEVFLDKLGQFSEQFDVGVHTYCCMANHFHLLLSTRQANLSRFMQSFLTSFSISLNRIRRRSGHIFQGRFKAELVEAQRYLSEASRYIHLNPLRTKRCEGLGLAERRRELLDFPWSSYGVLIGLAERPSWMATEPVLTTWGGSDEERMRSYRRYVEQGLTAKLPSPFLSIQEQSILGSESFVESIRRKYLLKRGIGDEREETSLKHLVRSQDAEVVVAAVGVEYGVAVAELLKRRSGCREGRQLAMYLVATLCRHGQPLAQLAEQFGVTNAGLGIARSRMAEALANQGHGALRARCDRVRNALDRRPLVDS